MKARVMLNRLLPSLVILAALGGCASGGGSSYGGVNSGYGPYGYTGLAEAGPYDDGDGGFFLGGGGYGGYRHDGGFYRQRDAGPGFHHDFAGRPGAQWSGNAAHAGFAGRGGGHAGGGGHGGGGHGGR